MDITYVMIKKKREKENILEESFHILLKLIYKTIIGISYLSHHFIILSFLFVFYILSLNIKRNKLNILCNVSS